MSVPPFAQRGTRRRYMQTGAHGVIACVARASGCNASGAYPRSSRTPHSLRGICVYIRSGAFLSFLYREEEVQGVQREEPALARSGEPIPRTPLGGYGGRNGEERRGSAWADTARSRPSRPDSLHAREAGNSASGNNGRDASTGFSIRSIRGRIVAPARRSVILSDVPSRARLAPFPAHLFGAHNHAAFGCDNARRQPGRLVQPARVVRSVRSGEGVGGKMAGGCKGGPLAADFTTPFHDANLFGIYSETLTP